MAERDLPPELPNGTYVILTWVGDSGAEHRDVVVREDVHCDPGDPHRWYLAAWDRWLDWAGLHAEGDVEEVVPRSEVDRLVEQARREASVTPLGTHLKEPGGYCATCGHEHSTTEWARIHDQLTEEPSRGE